jgi:GTPase SAR1 family protein
MFKCFLRLNFLRKGNQPFFRDVELLVPIDSSEGLQSIIYTRYRPILAEEYPDCFLKSFSFTKKPEKVNDKKGFEGKELSELDAKEIQDYIVSKNLYEAPLYNHSDLQNIIATIPSIQKRLLEKNTESKKKQVKFSESDIVKIVEKEREKDKGEIEELKSMVNQLLDEKSYERKANNSKPEEPVENYSEEEFEALKAKASGLGITYPPNIKYSTLLNKVKS